MTYQLDPMLEKPALGPDPQDQHHGDLRKGAFLRRRAAYQMEANAPRAAQAGTLGLTTQATQALRKIL